jgi:hypothetical protein
MSVMERMSSKLDPAYSVIRKFDMPGKSGTVVLAERLGRDRSTVQKWTMAREQRGTGGFIPYPYHDEIEAFAEELGIPFERSEFLSRRAEAAA